MNTKFRNLVIVCFFIFSYVTVVGQDTNISGNLIMTNGINLNTGDIILRNTDGCKYGIGYNSYGTNEMVLFSDDKIDFRESDASLLRARFSLNQGLFYFNGKLSVGTSDLTNSDGTAYSFTVKGDSGFDGKVECDELEVKNVALADYVFADDYKLKSLSEVEAFVKENKHLPNVPSAADVAENGMNVGQFQNILLEKVEELTLYMIELKKENAELKAKIENIK